MTAPLILVTGASGFVAAHVLNAFLDAGYRVRGTVRSEASGQAVKESHAKYSDRLSTVIVRDIQDRDAFKDALAGVDGVVHTASPFVLSVEDNARDLLDPAINGTRACLEAVQAFAPQVKRVVITSSFAAIIDLNQGVRPGYTYSEADWNPVSYDEAKAGSGVVAYCASKTFAERAAWEFVETQKPNFTVSTICPPMIYGPLDHKAPKDKLNTSSADIYRFMDGSTAEPGETAFPAFVDVRDVGEAHRRAYELKTGERFFVISGNFQYSDVCAVIKKALPGDEKVTSPGKTEKVETFKVDHSKAEKLLGIKFRSLDETITDTVKSLAALG